MPSITESMARIQGKLVVSCQAWAGDPLDDTEALRRIAQAVVKAGANGLRIHGAELIAAIRRDTSLPIIGIEKRYFNGEIRITPDFAAAARLASAGASIIALDCTERAWSWGEPWRACIERIHRELKLPVLADIATLREGLAAAEAGADMIGTTLSGYTEQTKGNTGFDWKLLEELVRQTGRPIVAEGRISLPSEAKRAIERGAWCAVVGSAITRPGDITVGFARAVASLQKTAPAIGVDIGATTVKAGLVDRQGVVSCTVRVPTDASQGRKAIAASTAESIERVLASARKENSAPIGLGIASAGVIDARTGTVFGGTGALPEWTGFDLRGFVEERFQLPARVHNDAHAAALAELRFGLGHDLSSFVALTLGTGVGGGIVFNGRMVQGQYGFAGTIGHQTIRLDGRKCMCGRHGCLEAYVSTAALIREYRDRQPTGPSDAETDASLLSRKISELALAGDPAAQDAYAALAGYLAEGVANLFNILDPEAVILSGGLVEGRTHFVAKVESQVQALLHNGEKRKPRVQLSSLGLFAGSLGAAAAIFEADEQGNL